MKRKLIVKEWIFVAYLQALGIWAVERVGSGFGSLQREAILMLGGSGLSLFVFKPTLYSFVTFYDFRCRTQFYNLDT